MNDDRWFFARFVEDVCADLARIELGWLVRGRFRGSVQVIYCEYERRAVLYKSRRKAALSLTRDLDKGWWVPELDDAVVQEWYRSCDDEG